MLLVDFGFRPWAVLEYRAPVGTILRGWKQSGHDPILLLRLARQEATSTQHGLALSIQALRNDVANIIGNERNPRSVDAEIQILVKRKVGRIRESDKRHATSVRGSPRTFVCQH
jgi:hypothetical protein